MRRSERHRSPKIRLALRQCLGVLVCLFLALPVPAQTAGAGKSSARYRFQQAEKQRTALQGQPQKDRTLSAYERVVAAYRRVYMSAPQAAEAPAAIRAVAELYHEMGRQFDPKYYQSAIDTYQFLLHEYPKSRHRDDALFTIGEIQKEDLNQLTTADLTFQEFLRSFPRSPKAEQAKQALDEIAAAREQERKPSTSKKLAEQREQQRQLPRVTNIRHWNAENYTRIVIDVEEEVKHQGARISNPDRIYFDVYKAKLSPTLTGKTLEVQSGFLKTIRVAQNQAGVVRVVLEVDKVKDYSVFQLPNPYRLVIDVYGEGATTAKATEKPAASQPAKTEKAMETTAAKTETARAEPPPAKQSTKSAPTAKEAAAALSPPPVPQPTRNGQHSLTRALGLKIGRIVIDAGHGGHDTGTIGPTGLMEKDLCLDLALRLGKMIQDRLPGAEILYTREDDTFVPLETRTALANQEKADLFLSIHANSSRDRQARGVETYYLNFAASEDAMEVAARENALSQASIHELQDLIKKIARNEKIEESRELATEIQQALAKRLQRSSRSLKSRGVKKAPFVVLIGANMPSVLSEVSFLSNPTDEQLLKKPEHRQRVAEGLFHGVQRYLESLNSLSHNQQKPAETIR